VPTAKHGLGRGFDALIPTDGIDPQFDPTLTRGNASPDKIVTIPTGNIDPNPHQPRQRFDEAQLASLAESIRVHGILQPVVVTKLASGRYQLIAGERRLRAAKLIPISGIPAIVRTFDEQQKLELALIENLQRADLNPLETATAYKKLADQFNLSYDQMSERVGRDRSTIANSIRLLKLPQEAKEALVNGDITEGHARVILSLNHQLDKQATLLKMIIENYWNVRQAESFARSFKHKSVTPEKALEKASDDNEVTRSLADFLGTKVEVRHKAKGKGVLLIQYYSDEELDRIYRRIRGE
jgi:ParB family chromosome partitioning protein